MFCKSEFKGVFYIEVGSDSARQVFPGAVDAFAKRQRGSLGGAVWAKPDPPPTSARSAWSSPGCAACWRSGVSNEASIEIDADCSSMSVARAAVAKTVVKDFRFELQWVDLEWGGVGSAGLSEITAAAQANFDRAKGSGESRGGAETDRKFRFLSSRRRAATTRKY
ncbi:unnamed protein product [Prorocentrum cordatum]|uniref:Uncharacterized protein n=1 Tax=Prorocentrum cordatum TaxID=2364126 RepID=A0ABN9QEE0_9DINO|nr:unnamed protein product [Polarella glacialis]